MIDRVFRILNVDIMIVFPDISRYEINTEIGMDIAGVQSDKKIFHDLPRVIYIVTIIHIRDDLTYMIYEFVKS